MLKLTKTNEKITFTPEQSLSEQFIKNSNVQSVARKKHVMVNNTLNWRKSFYASLKMLKLTKTIEKITFTQEQSLTEQCIYMYAVYSKTKLSG